MSEIIKRRGGEILCFLGHNNTGKSAESIFYIEQFCKKRKKIKNKNKNFNRLAVFDPQNRYQKYLEKGDLNITPLNDDWFLTVSKFRDSLVVLDDHRQLIDTDTIDKRILNLLFLRSEYGIDFIIITHFAKLIQPKLVGYIDKYLMFYNLGEDKDFDRTANSKLFIKLKEIINKEYRRYSPEEYDKLYPNFPYIYYNGRNDRAVKINFKK